MNKKLRLSFSIICFVAIDLLSIGFSQTLSPVGNTNFPVNDNTVSAPVSAINGGWQINGIGKVIKIVPHPSSLTTLYACTASGGIFKSTNSGTTWSPVSGSFLPGVQFGSLAIDPTNTNIMYAGTGEPSYSQEYGWGAFGVFKSTNGGATWAQSTTGMGNLVVLDLLINPSNTQQVIAATSNGIFRSTNGGTNWSAVLAATGSWVAQVLRQGAGSNLIAIGNTRFYRSTDFGVTWSTTDLDPSFSSTFANGRIAVAPTNSNVVYAGWVNNTFSSANNAAMFYSTDGGVSFTKKYAFANALKLISYDGSNTAGYGWANFFITVSKTDPNTLYTGGHIIFKSLDNGASWVQTTSNWYCCIHTDIHELLYDPNNAGRFLASTDGGVFLSTDDAANWAPLSNGLSCNQYLSMGQSNLDSNFVIGALQDNGIIYQNTDGNYHTYTGGDVYDHMTCDYTNLYNVYTSNTGGKVFNPYNRSQKANLNLPSGTYTTGTANNRQSFFLSPIDPTIAYAWGTNVWRSNNINSYNLAAGTSSVSWTQISSFNTPINDVKISPVNNNIVYALGDNATVYKSVNATSGSPVFSPISLPAGASSSVEGSLTVSTLNPNVLYATANNGVYRSANAGSTWTDYTATGLPDINFEKIFVDPYSSIESVYLVTTLGIYYRDLTMNAWIPVNPQVPVQQQNATANYSGLVNGESLFKGTSSATSHITFATWGSGIWKAGFYSQLNNTLPSNWNNTDIGSPALAGSAFYDSNKKSYNVKGGGTGINNSSTDQFNFTSTTVSGSSDIIAKVYSVAETDPTNGLSKTGIMLRSSTNANSPYVMVALTGHAGGVFQYRATAGAVATVMTVSPGPSINYPYWLKLNKSATNIITASISPDSLVWTQVGQANVSLGATFLAGIANTSTNAALLNNAAVNKVSLTNFNTLAIDNIELYAAVKEKHKVDLLWSFATNEKDNSISIERSSEGINFSPIVQKSYVNNNSTLQTISDAFTDETPFSGNNYYRLKIIQKDGQVKYSNIQHITIAANILVKLEPNPVRKNSELKIMISGAPLSKMQFNIYDFTGKKIQSEIFTNSGNNSIYLNNISAGAYFYKLMYDGQVVTGKLIINDK